MRVMYLAVLLIFAQPAAANSVEISNFRSGLACTKTTPTGGRAGWICQPTELILVTDQGKCVYNHEDKLCTWVGFEFDYRSSVKGSKLRCISHSSEPTNQGNPDGIQKKDLTADQFEIELPEKLGHFFNPQYFVFNAKYPGEDDLLIETQCASSGKPVFSFKFRIHFPVIRRP